MHGSFATFIVSHGRPDKVNTYAYLKKISYPLEDVFIVCDDEDKTLSDYQKAFGDRVIVFSKKKASDKFDIYDNIESRAVVVYARNECFDIAARLGYEFFVVLDDDYRNFMYRYNELLAYEPKTMNTALFSIFESMFVFMKNTSIKCLACLQGGDFMGGVSNERFAHGPMLSRKVMNIWCLSSKRKFEINGRLNEDVNVYSGPDASCGNLYFSTNLFSVDQEVTQKNSGGLTEVYLELGTYVKSFYSVMANPSCVKITDMGRVTRRVHHKILYDYCVPKVISESNKKER
jgi:hypothetical protein